MSDGYREEHLALLKYLVLETECSIYDLQKGQGEDKDTFIVRQEALFDTVHLLALQFDPCHISLLHLSKVCDFIRQMKSVQWCDIHIALYANAQPGKISLLLLTRDFKSFLLAQF